MNKLRELCEKWQLPNINIRGDGGEGSTDISYSATRLQCAAQLRAIIPDVEQLVEALRWYAEENNWDEEGIAGNTVESHCHGEPTEYDWDADNGYRARAALAFFDQPVAPKETK